MNLTTKHNINDVETETETLEDVVDETTTITEQQQDDTNNNVNEQQIPSPSTNELARFFLISTPNTLTMLLMFLQMSVTLSVSAQHLGTEAMSGISLANLTANLTCLTLVYGLLSAVDTLAPQAFAAGNLAEVGILVQRGLVTVMFTLFIVIVAVWMNIETILLAVGQPPIESHLAATFLHTYSLAMPGLAIWESGRRFMWSQDVSQWPFVMITFGAFMVHVLGVNVLVSAMGFQGAAVAHVITVWSTVCFFFTWVYWKRPHHPDTWHAATFTMKRVLDPHAMFGFMKLGIAGVGTTLEWVFFEMFVGLSGELGETALATNSILYAIIPVCYTISAGVSIATTTRIGALLAQGKIDVATHLARNIGIVTICVGSTIATSVALLREPLISIFSTQAPVQELARFIWPRLCLLLFLDAIFTVQCGLLRALGMQPVYAMIVFLCLFCFALPLIGGLAFPWGLNMGLAGMWLGMPGSYIVLNWCLFVSAWWKDWSKYSAEVMERERITALASASASTTLPPSTVVNS